MIVLEIQCTLQRFKTSCARCSKATLEHDQSSSVIFFGNLGICELSKKTCRCDMSRGYFSQSSLTCQYAFWQILIWIFIDMLSTVKYFQIVLWPCPGRLATISWSLNILKLFRTAITGILGRLEMVSLAFTFTMLVDNCLFFCQLSPLLSLVHV